MDLVWTWYGLGMEMVWSWYGESPKETLGRSLEDPISVTPKFLIVFQFHLLVVDCFGM